MFQPNQLKESRAGKSTKLLAHQTELELGPGLRGKKGPRLLPSLSSGNRLRLHVLGMLKQGVFGRFTQLI